MSRNVPLRPIVSTSRAIDTDFSWGGDAAQPCETNPIEPIRGGAKTAAASGQRGNVASAAIRGGRNEPIARWRDPALKGRAWPGLIRNGRRRVGGFAARAGTA